jgi:hypothetical protein
MIPNPRTAPDALSVSDGHQTVGFIIARSDTRNSTDHYNKGSAVSWTHVNNKSAPASRSASGQENPAHCSAPLQKDYTR